MSLRRKTNNKYYCRHCMSSHYWKMCSFSGVLISRLRFPHLVDLPFHSFVYLSIYPPTTQPSSNNYWVVVLCLGLWEILCEPNNRAPSLSGPILVSVCCPQWDPCGNSSGAWKPHLFCHENWIQLNGSYNTIFSLFSPSTI